MKKIFILLVFVLSFYYSSVAQKVTVIEGKQVKESQNLHYSGKPMYVPQKSKIRIVDGAKTSFSLRIDNQTKYQFYYIDGKYEPPIYGGTTIIEPGMYNLYPDLPIGVDSVWVRVELVSIEM